MAAVSQTTFSNAFSWMRIYAFWLKIHWNLFLGVQLAISQYWFRYWLVACPATSHYLNQCWSRVQTHICVTWPSLSGPRDFVNLVGHYKRARVSVGTVIKSWNRHYGKTFSFNFECSFILICTGREIVWNKHICAVVIVNCHTNMNISLNYKKMFVSDGCPWCIFTSALSYFIPMTRHTDRPRDVYNSHNMHNDRVQKISQQWAEKWPTDGIKSDNTMPKVTCDT